MTTQVIRSPDAGGIRFRPFGLWITRTASGANGLPCPGDPPPTCSDLDHRARADLGTGRGVLPAPEPTPTPTAAFASEEEAFAAAEETYRAYIEATNAERAGDTSQTSLDYLTGQAHDQELAAQRDLESRGVRIEGTTQVASFDGVRSNQGPQSADVEAHACLDITNARAIDEAGIDVTADGRSDIYGINITFTGPAGSLLIAAIELNTDLAC